jgi:hypothetical protein
MSRVRAEIKTLFAPFVSGELSSWPPDDPVNFGFDLQVFIGVKGEDAVDSFDVFVCTPRWGHRSNEVPASIGLTQPESGPPDARVHRQATRRSRG